LTFCTQCGARADDAYCTTCGAPNRRFQSQVTPSEDASPPTPPRVESDPLGAEPPPYWLAPMHAAGADAAYATLSVDTDEPAPLVAHGPARTMLVAETRAVMFAFLVPPVVAAVVLLAQHVSGVGGVTRFPQLLDQPVANLVFGIIEYLTVGSVVPIGLFLLARTGQTPKRLGICVPGLRSDVWPALGLAVAAYVSEVVLLIPFAPILAHHSSLVSKVPIGHVPKYYVIWGIAISAITAISEEVLVNGYLITRLEQLGWTRRAALTLSVVLRTSYHVYYGIGFLLTIPFGIYVTRSFQKHHRLIRPIVAHFLFDAVLLTIAILA
jgi:membrane protease YdiL (CAAX protease family)